MSSSKNWG